MNRRSAPILGRFVFETDSYGSTTSTESAGSM